MKLILNLTLICVLLFTAFSCNDKGVDPIIGEWENLGLEGKLVNDIKLIDTYLYACAGKDGLYRLDLSKSNSAWSYLGFADSGLFRQLDYGVTSLIKIQSSNEFLIGLATYRDSTEIGIFRSSETNLTWIPSDSGIRNIAF